MKPGKKQNTKVTKRNLPPPFEKDFLVNIDFSYSDTQNSHDTFERHRTFSDASGNFDFYGYESHNSLSARARAYTEDSNQSDCAFEVPEKDHFEHFTLKISSKGGILLFEDPNFEEASIHSLDSLSSTSTCSLSTLDTLVDGENDLDLVEGLGSELDHESDQMEDRHFPLTDTNVHRPKHYKSASIGETYEAFKIAFNKGKIEESQESQSLLSEEITTPILPESDTTEVEREETQKRRKDHTPIRAKRRKDIKYQWELQTGSITKSNSTISTVMNKLNYRSRLKIRLQPEDEIHASPCQCALRLVGLVSAPPPNQTTYLMESSKNDLSTVTKKQRFNQKSNKNETNFVRTVSGKEYYGNMNAQDHSRLKYPVLSAEKHRMKLGGPASLSPNSTPVLQKKKSQISIFPKMSSPGMFSTLHEVTLIKSSSFHPIKSSNFDNELYDDWSAITIQCGDHDEMDLLIQALRDSSKSKVVPFSMNPKSKLKKRQHLSKPMNVKRKLSNSKSPLGHKNGLQHKRRDSTKQSAVSIKRQFHHEEHCELCQEKFSLLHRRHHCRACMISCCSKCSSVHPDCNGKHTRYCKSCKNFNPCMYKKPGNRFHNNDHCELCTLHFTLLTRRHHCRKCDRSCCSSCSSIIMIKGGVITRYCHQCNNKLRNSLSANTSSSLPGKVHPACTNLGVGVVGKIPHWINFFNPDDIARPAVARLTVELIEAIALPTLDFHGKIDPYVRATITGYDYDMKLNLKEWYPHKRYTLSGTYSAGTTSPVWLGPGRHGGELLTLPVLRTSGAVLRLEVLHFDVMTNSKGKDNVLGVVEIPLADIPNANLRETTVMKKKGCKAYDGFVNRWYQLQSPVHTKNKGVMLATPMDDPRKKIPFTDSNSKIESNGLPSWEELGQKTQALFVAPIDWISAVLNLDMPRHPTVKEYHRRSQSATIHIRLKLNASEMGDLLSHAWFPLVQPNPDIVQFDPQILWSNINKVLKELDPYLKLFKYCEDIIKWKHSPSKCLFGFLVVAFHILYVDKLILFLHVYLFRFLIARLQDMTFSSNMSESVSLSGIRMSDSFDSGSLGRQSTMDSESEDSSLIENSSSGTQNLESSPKNTDAKIEHEAHLNKTLSWIAKIIGENRGLEHVQHKLANMHKDLRNVNSLWDGSSVLKTRVTIFCVGLSFVLHFIVNRKFLWILGIASLHLSKSPDIIRFCRMIFGFHRGWAQIVRRRQLHLNELNQSQRSFFKES